tara:strand:+ start:434 stop:820 length:387 start_codon:yes stop_codon:yes gene_type:complete
MLFLIFFFFFSKDKVFVVVVVATATNDDDDDDGILGIVVVIIGCVSAVLFLRKQQHQQKRVMLCSILKKAHNEREKMRAKSTFCTKRTKEAHTKGTMMAKFHTILVFICGHTPFPKKDILLYFLCALL